MQCHALVVLEPAPSKYQQSQKPECRSLNIFIVKYPYMVNLFAASLYCGHGEEALHLQNHIARHTNP